MKIRKGYGNCPVCYLCVDTGPNGITPRHGHIRHGKEWLPACRGSGRTAINIVWGKWRYKT